MVQTKKHQTSCDTSFILHRNLYWAEIKVILFFCPIEISSLWI